MFILPWGALRSLCGIELITGGILASTIYCLLMFLLFNAHIHLNQIYFLSVDCNVHTPPVYISAVFYTFCAPIIRDLVKVRIKKLFGSRTGVNAHIQFWKILLGDGRQHKRYKHFQFFKVFKKVRNFDRQLVFFFHPSDSN